MMDGGMNKRPGESPAGLIDQLRAEYVTTPRDLSFLDHLGRVLHRDADGQLMLEPTRFGPQRATRGIIVAERSGEGKSSLIGRALSVFREAGDKRHVIPGDVIARPGSPTLMSLVTPSPGTMKSVGLEVLEKTGYAEVSDRREKWGIWKIVRHRVELCGVRLIWFDEAQHILSEGSRTERTEALNAIKNLMAGPSACTVILSGIETLEDIREIDPQIEGRFTFFRLKPMTGPKERRKLTSILTDLCATAGLCAPGEPTIVDRLLHGVDGRFGRSIEVMIEAIILALHQKATALDLQHFAESWAITTACEPLGNVFLAKNWADIPIARDADKHDGASRAKERGRKKTS